MSEPWRNFERGVVAVSALLVAGLVGALVWLELSAGDTGPRVEARVLTTGTVVTFEVRNAGDKPVAEVQVEVVQGEDAVGHTFAHLPAGAVRKGTAVFERPGRPTAKVRGYLEP